MAPLPCSPNSQSANSEESNSQSSQVSDGDSDNSLGGPTPRPGPTDPSQRTESQLSKPAIPGGASSTAGAAILTSSDDNSGGGKKEPRRVSFSSNTSLPKPRREGSYSFIGNQKMAGHAEEADGDAGGESSADENTAIMKKNRQLGRYGAADGFEDGAAADDDVQLVKGKKGATNLAQTTSGDSLDTVRRKTSNVPRGRSDPCAESAVR